MSTKGKYQTRQMAELLSYLETMRGEHVTVAGICEHFRNQGITVGTTTVYRHLERMVSDGTVAKYVIDGTSSACFEYIGELHTEEEHTPCLHCKCEKCGKLIHVHCHEIAGIGQHMYEEHGFWMDMCRTIFYGLCEECRTKQQDGQRKE